MKKKRKKKKEKIIIHGICQCESCKKMREKNRKNIISINSVIRRVMEHQSGKKYSGVSRKKVDELIITNLYDEELKRISKKTLKKEKKKK